MSKNIKATLLFVDFSKAFDSILKRKMKQILLAYDHILEVFSKETVYAIMMLHKEMVYLHNGGTDFFDIIPGVLQGDTLILFLFIISQDYELRGLIEENGFKLKIGKKQTISYRRYHGCRFQWWSSASN